MARPVFKTGLRPSRGRGGSIPPHSAAVVSTVNFFLATVIIAICFPLLTVAFNVLSIISCSLLVPTLKNYPGNLHSHEGLPGSVLTIV